MVDAWIAMHLSAGRWVGFGLLQCPTCGMKYSMKDIVTPTLRGQYVQAYVAVQPRSQISVASTLGQSESPAMKQGLESEWEMLRRRSDTCFTISKRFVFRVMDAMSFELSMVGRQRGLLIGQAVQRQLTG